MLSNFELFLFTTDPAMVVQAGGAGVHGFIVDLENRGKSDRQKGYDTQVNHNTVADLRRVRSSTDRPVLCRINQFGTWTPAEIEQVVAAGADEIFLPMVRTPNDVMRTLDLIRDRCRLAILVETTAAAACARSLANFPLSRIYVGLNDLAIDRGLANIFDSVCDGTVDKVRRQFTIPFGFGGLTLPEAGFPIPCRLLMAEMMRLDCQFTFLRRSFSRDIAGRDMAIEVPRMLDALEEMRHRNPEAAEKDRQAFASAVAAWDAGASLKEG